VIRVVIDNFRRQDHSGFAKAMWTILIIFLPVIGVVSYLIARPSEIVVEGW
jgi:heme/copper-type cytochrome/quinol oxidase subunit 2